MKTEIEVEGTLKRLELELKRLESDTPHLRSAWWHLRGHIAALRWVLGIQSSAPTAKKGGDV